MSKNYSVYFRDRCFYVDVGKESLPLSLAPWGFGPGYCSVCAYPHKHRYHDERKEVIKYKVNDEEHREIYEISYVATYAPGLYYGDFYRTTDIQLDELYKHCYDLETLLKYLNDVKPMTNLLSILILCCKKTKNNIFFDILGKALAKAINRFLSTLDASSTVITYVPRHPDEYKVDMFTNERYNQAELLAQVVARELKLNSPRGVVYVKMPMGGKSQRKLPRRERYRLVAQAYDLIDGVKDLIKGKTVILVDDVRTSGATVWSISRLLSTAEPKEVHIAVAGRSILRNHFRKFISKEISVCRPPWL